MTGTNTSPNMSQPTSSTDLAAALAAHRDWLNGNGGRRADLRDADLRYADLRDADLRYANLRYANLRDANLRYANLYGANLYGADLRSADLRSADLRDADLRYTCVSLLIDDDGRGYQVVAHHGFTSDSEPVYLAGCRQLTITGARKHWKDQGHQAPESAAKILAAIEAHHAEWEANR